MTGTWSQIFILSAAVDKRLAPFFSPHVPADCPWCAAGATGQSLVFSRVRWLGYHRKRGTVVASRCRCRWRRWPRQSQCAQMWRWRADAHKRKRHSLARWCSAFAWLHCMHRKIQNTYSVFICKTAAAKPLAFKHQHRKKQTYRDSPSISLILCIYILITGKL